MAEPSGKRLEIKRWLRDRLTKDERARAEWRKLWEASWDSLLQTPVRDLIDPNAAKSLADRLAVPETISALSRPVVAGIARALIAELREDHRPVEEMVPLDARETLKAALARPGLVHPDWVRAMLQGEVVEAVINDALYMALKDFSRLLPRIMVKMSPAGRFGMLGSAGAFAERMIGEVEKFIEPEIRSFIADSSGRVLESAVEFTIAKMDDPASIEFQLAFIDFILSKSPAFFLETTDEQLIDDMGAVLEITALHLAEAPETREAIHGWVDQLMDYCADKTLGEVLQVDESNASPPIDAMADATWPVLTALVASKEALRWMDTLVDELIDEYERKRSS